MSVDKDYEQDILIQQNAEHIKRNEEAIQRQTACLEKIRDHYFPRQTFMKRSVGFLLKVVGAVTVATGIMETADWYWNTRLTESMAAQSAAVAKRLFLRENDAAGAVRFLEKAVELDSGTVRYRIALAYVRGIAALVDFFDINRPLALDERARIDAILAEAVFLQETSPDEPMPYILAAQAYSIRGERELAFVALDRAIALAPENALVRANACAVRFAFRDFESAKAEIEAAARADAKLPLVHYWRGMLADVVDGDGVAAQKHISEMIRLAPSIAIGHVARGRMLMEGALPDLVGARVEFNRALAAAPSLKNVMRLMAESYEREGNLTMAKLWLDRALECDGKFMNALTARARVNGKKGDWAAAVQDLTTAVKLAPLRAELYGERAVARDKVGDAAGAANDRRMAADISSAAK